jgi:hypothetical protein
MSHSSSAVKPDPTQASFEKWGTVILVLVGFLLFFIILCMVYLPNMGDRVDIEQTNERKKKISEMRAHEQKESTHYGWVDKANGVVQIPISLAMDLTVRDLAVNAKPARSNFNPSSE